jgi:hypothetical protein
MQDEEAERREQEANGLRYGAVIHERALSHALTTDADVSVK